MLGRGSLADKGRASSYSHPNPDLPTLDQMPNGHFGKRWQLTTSPSPDPFKIKEKDLKDKVKGDNHWEAGN